MVPPRTPSGRGERAADLIGCRRAQDQVEIERLLAERFPKSDLLTWVAEMPVDLSRRGTCPGHVDDPQVVAKSSSDSPQLVPGRVESRGRMTPALVPVGGAPGDVEPGDAARSCATRRSCSGTRSRAVTWPRCSTGCWIWPSPSSRSRSLAPPPRPRAAAGDGAANPRYIPLHVRARGLEAGWRAVHVRGRERSSLRSAPAARVRPCARGRAR